MDVCLSKKNVFFAHEKCVLLINAKQNFSRF